MVESVPPGSIALIDTIASPASRKYDASGRPTAAADGIDDHEKLRALVYHAIVD